MAIMTVDYLAISTQHIPHDTTNGPGHQQSLWSTPPQSHTEIGQPKSTETPTLKDAARLDHNPFHTEPIVTTLIKGYIAP